MPGFENNYHLCYLCNEYNEPYTYVFGDENRINNLVEKLNYFIRRIQVSFSCLSTQLLKIINETSVTFQVIISYEDYPNIIICNKCKTFVENRWNNNDEKEEESNDENLSEEEFSDENLSEEAASDESLSEYEASEEDLSDEETSN